MKRVYHYVVLMRLNRPIGITLLMWPMLIALWFASHGQPDRFTVVIFILGAVVTRSAGVIINDLTDRRFDGHVQRTKMRPLVTGKVTPKEAYGLLMTLLLIALLLVSLTNVTTLLLSLCAVVLIAIYPWMKRYTHFPQVILGATFGMAIPMAYTAQGQPLDFNCGLLYIAFLLWSVAYDTLYAMVDREDDMLIGVKSTAIYFNHYDRLAVLITHLGMLFMLYYVGQQFHLNGFFTLSLVIALSWILYQQWQIRDRERQARFKAFLDNQWMGMVLFLGVLLGF